MSLVNIFTLDLDLKRKNYISEPVITSSDTVRFVVNVTDDDLPVDLTDMTIVSISHTRSDGIVVLKSGTKTGSNQVSFDFGSTETSVPGRVDAKIQMYDVNNRVSTLDFGYMVTKDPSGENYVPSTDDRTLIEQVLGEGPQILDDAEEATANANNAANNANTTVSNIQDAEDSRVVAESARVSAENTRQSNESTRNASETARITAENTRDTQEDTRIANETARVLAEDDRVTAESARASSETTRQTNETTRQTNETTRQNQESQRQTDTANAIASIEATSTDIQDAEDSRVVAENNRVISEDSRVSSENTRQSNETTRQSNETARVIAETTRDAQEDTRVANETTRELAEDDRESAEASRVSSETTRQNNETTRQNQESQRQTDTANAISSIEDVRDSFVHLGDYSASTTYQENNEVRYNGSTWRCLQTTTGRTPVEGAYWTLVASRGLDGEGAVSSVNNISPDMNGNVVLTATDIGAETPSGAQAKVDAAVGAIQLTADNVTISDAGSHFTSTDVEGALAELFQNVSDGKTTLASAITAMGQSALGSMTFAQLAAAIGNISDDATATVGEVLAGETFYQGGIKRTGTMPNLGGVVGLGGMRVFSSDITEISVHPNNSLYGLIVGKPNKVGYMNRDSDISLDILGLVPSNIKKDVVIGNDSVDGAKMTGTLIPASGNATAGDLLSGKTATNDSGEIAGTMPDLSGTTLAYGPNASAYETRVSDSDPDYRVLVKIPIEHVGKIEGGFLDIELWGIAPRFVLQGQSIGKWDSPVKGTLIPASGTASAGDLLSGKTATNENGPITGTLPNRPAGTLAVNAAVWDWAGTPTIAVRIPAPGSYVPVPGQTYSEIQLREPDLRAENIRKDVTLFEADGGQGITGSLIPASGNAGWNQVLQGYSASNASGGFDGAMPNYAGQTIYGGSEGLASITIHSNPAYGKILLRPSPNVFSSGVVGYITKDSQLESHIFGLIPSNIRSGVHIGNTSVAGAYITGTLVPGKRSASGNTTGKTSSGAPQLSIRGLSFTPSIIICDWYTGDVARYQRAVYWGGGYYSSAINPTVWSRSGSTTSPQVGGAHVENELVPVAGGFDLSYMFWSEGYGSMVYWLAIE